MVSEGCSIVALIAPGHRAGDLAEPLLHADRLMVGAPLCPR